MKNIKLTGVLFATLALLFTVRAQAPTIVPHVWGAASNGMSAGIVIRPSDWIDHKGDYYCDIDVRNLTDRVLYMWTPRIERRYELKLFGPDGQPVRQVQGVHLGSINPWRARPPFDKDPDPERSCLNWFFLKETFDIRTNGQYTLVASVRVNAFTNFAKGLSQMRKAPTYFLLPPVTNTFKIEK